MTHSFAIIQSIEPPMPSCGHDATWVGSVTATDAYTAAEKFFLRDFEAPTTNSQSFAFRAGKLADHGEVNKISAPSQIDAVATTHPDADGIRWQYWLIVDGPITPSCFSHQQ